MFSSNFIMATAMVLLSATSTIANPAPSPVAAAVATSSPIAVGCFSSSYSMTFENTYGFQTSGYCQDICVPLNKPVIAINGTDCWCGDTMPPADDKVTDSECTTPCPGYGDVNCGTSDGATSYFTVWNAGLKSTLTNANDPSSSSSAAAAASSSSSSTSGSSTSSGSGTTSASPSVVTIGGQTIVVTASATAKTSGASDSSSSHSSGPSKAGIAAGVVVGVIAAAAIAGGVFLFIRAKRRRAVEEEYKRQAAISAFTTGQKPGSSGGLSMNDTRLEPAIMRRMSDGSIADNQDYSRRILKVTNA